jgi:hypothetical protein
LREGRRLRVFEISHKRDELTGEWGKLHKEELNDLYNWDNSPEHYLPFFCDVISKKSYS